MEKLLLPPLRDYQKTVLISEAIDDVTISAPQLGKTATGQVWLLCAAWLHGEDIRPWWWTSPTYVQAIHGMRGLAFMARSAGILLGEPRMSPPLEIRLTNGARIEGRSWERPGGMFGPSILGAVIDEFGQLSAEAYGAISSRRAETLHGGFGRYRYLGNVGQVQGVAHKLWEMAERGDRGFASRQWTWRDRALADSCACDVPLEVSAAYDHDDDCPRAVYHQYIYREAERMSRPQFRQLWEAEWCDWNDLPVYEFDRQIHVDDTIELQDRIPLEIGCDFNVDPMAWCIGQHHGDEAWTFDEIAIPGGATTEAACREVVRRYPSQRQEVVIYGDASGGARKTSASQTDYQIIRTILGGHYLRFTMSVPRSNPPVADRVNAVNALLRSASGKTRYRVHPRCTGLINDRARVSWKPGTRDIDKRDKTLTHYADGDDYRLHSLFPVHGPTVVEVGTGPEFGTREESMNTVQF